MDEKIVFYDFCGSVDKGRKIKVVVKKTKVEVNCRDHIRGHTKFLEWYHALQFAMGDCALNHGLASEDMNFNIRVVPPANAEAMSYIIYAYTDPALPFNLLKVSSNGMVSGYFSSSVPVVFALLRYITDELLSPEENEIQRAMNAGKTKPQLITLERKDIIKN